MTRLPLGTWDTPGTWTPHLRTDGSKGAIFVCPLCKNGHVLTADIRKIEEYHGEVIRREAKTPAVVCMTPQCQFKDDVILLWWTK